LAGGCRLIEWHFIRQLPCYVDSGITQRDQFRNDEVDLYETIVREAVQNSLDATPNGKQTRVSFRWANGETGLDGGWLREILEKQLEHAAASGLETEKIDFSSPSALVIEDFGTTGLTGSVEDKDNGDFSGFWRRHGKSHKTGTRRGRWGLGKLVYSSSAATGAFFGVTVREGDQDAWLMGQSVLDLHTYEGGEYPPHAYFSKMKGSKIQNMVPVPVNDTGYIREFSRQFGLTRNGEPGLSIAIPFPHESLTSEKMLGVAIINYFYPILTGKLVMEFNGQALDAENIRQLAHVYAKRKIPDIDELFSFIEETNRELGGGTLLSLRKGWLDDVRLDEDDFEPNDLDRLRTTFSEGRLVGVRLPLSVKVKPERKILDTEFHVFVKRPDSITKGIDLYVRGGLTLPAESKFGDRKAYGVMVANNEIISSFLGDAENPAHTKWIYNAEKLRKNYVSPGNRLKVIKNAVVNFYDVLTQAEEEEDDKALAGFFFTEEPEQESETSGGKNRPKPKTPPDDDIEVPRRKPRLARLETTEDGFSVRPGDGADMVRYPVRLRVRMAYDTASGNPFKKYSPFDFDFSGRSGSTPFVQATSDTVALAGFSPNELEFEISGPKFRIDVSGFDKNRDLLVKLRAVPPEET
ncbi:hypothetical protein, partial [Thiolapillus sp.]|uniref:hypothetical protein n=1 Tax=Thiolapillus sp. TaxID=2017437 RepID=UPI003AF6D614